MFLLKWLVLSFFCYTILAEISHRIVLIQNILYGLNCSCEHFQKFQNWLVRLKVSLKFSKTRSTLHPNLPNDFYLYRCIGAFLTLLSIAAPLVSYLRPYCCEITVMYTSLITNLDLPINCVSEGRFGSQAEIIDYSSKTWESHMFVVHLNQINGIDRHCRPDGPWSTKIKINLYRVFRLAIYE